MGVAAHVLNPRTCEVAAEGSGIQSQSWLYNKFGTSLGIIWTVGIILGAEET